MSNITYPKFSFKLQGSAECGQYWAGIYIGKHETNHVYIAVTILLAVCWLIFDYISIIMYDDSDEDVKDTCTAAAHVSSAHLKENSFNNTKIDLNSDQLIALYCEHCTDDVERPVVWCCSQCSEEYCLSCGELHIKAKKFRDHELTTSMTSVRKRSMSSKCGVHKSEDIKFVCETCDPAVMCCSICVYDGGHHENRHKIVSIESVASRLRDRLVLLKDQAEEFFNDEKKVLEDVDNTISLNQANLQNTIDWIKGGFTKLREVINEKEAAWVAQVESQVADTAGILTTERTTMVHQLGKAQVLIEITNRLMDSYSELEFLQHHKRIEENLCDALKVLMAPYELTGVPTAKGEDDALMRGIQSLLHQNPYQLPVYKIKIAHRQLLSSNEETQRYYDSLLEDK